MPLLSPGVLVQEKDFTTIVPTVATAIGGIAGAFNKGPIDTPILISSETKLREVFGEPDNFNAGEWFTGAQYLNYANKLWVVRSAPSGALNSAATSAVLVKNFDAYETAFDAAPAEPFPGAGEFIAKQPGIAGNGIKVYVVDDGNYDAFVALGITDANGNDISNIIPEKPATSTYAKNKAAVSTDNKKDELSIIVVDTTGTITGTANTVIEFFNYLSKASDAVDYKNDSIYFVDVINNQSEFIYFNNNPSGADVQGVTADPIYAWGDTAVNASGSGDSFQILAASEVSYTLTGGVTGTTPAPADIQNSYDEFKNPEEIDVNLLMTANHDTATIKYIVELAATRKDCVAFVSPHNSGSRFTNKTTMVTDLTTFKDTTLAIADQYQSYAVMDTGFKYIYDKYTRRYRWIPLNGDIAGITARTDDLIDPWWSPAGYNRGGIKNVIKLSYNPGQVERDILYPKGINPVVSFPGSGPMLFGDRTMQSKPSAFDRINVRRLFIVLEKAIAIAAKYQLFEMNDSFTRAQFRNMVEPFLRDVQGRRGITDFKVICDDSNNTGVVIDRNEFVADIYIKPARSINFITLSFVATRTGVDFSTVIGG